MAGTIQKRIKFSKGQIVPELVERTDLDAYDSSAQEMKNVVSSVYGGVRSRRGTKKIDRITSGLVEVTGTLTTQIGGDSQNIQDKSVTYTSNAIGTNRGLFHIDYTTDRTGGDLKLRAIKINSLQSVAKDIYISISTDDTNWTLVDTREISNEAQDFDIWIEDTFRYVKVELENTTMLYQGNVVDNHGIISGFSENDYGVVNIDVSSANSWEAVFKVKIKGKPNTGSLLFEYGSILGTPQLTNSFLGVNSENKLVIYSYSGSNIYLVGSTSLDDNKWYYVKFEFTGSKYVLYYSEDGITYTNDGELNSTTKINYPYTSIGVGHAGGGYAGEAYTPFNGEIDLNESCFKINGSMYIDWGEDPVSLTETYSIQYCLLNVGSDQKEPGKLVDYVYNNTDKYVLVLQNQSISIYKDDELVSRVSAIGLIPSYFPEIKWAYKDDTIVFTHKDMRTKILKRTSDTAWTWGDLDWQNIPYTLFGAETITAKTVGITPSATEGTVKITADSSIFSSDWVGQYIDGNGGRVKITEYISGTVVNGYTVIPFYTTDKITSWDYISGYKPVWGYEDPSDTTTTNHGYPRTCLFAQQRLWLGGSKDKPSTIWASRLGDYFNFKNSGNYDNDSINFDLLTNDVIVNMVFQRGIHVFTTGEEISISEGTLTPNKITCTPNTKNGSSSIVRPVVIDGVVCFVEKNGKSLLSYVYDETQASYLTDNMSIFSNLIQRPVAIAEEINSAKDKGNFLYMVLDDGTMIVGCVVVNQKIMSLSKFKTEAGDIKDVISLYGDTYILVDRKNYYYLEKIADVQTDCTTQVPVYDTTITVLSDYEGKEVYVYDDNMQIYGKGIVNDGQVSVFSVPNKTCHVGISFKYEIESNPIAINHKTTSIKKRITTAEIVCKDTPQLEFCGQKKTGKDNYKFFSCTKYDDDVRFRISGEFYKMQILSVQLNIDYGD